MEGQAAAVKVAVQGHWQGESTKVLNYHCHPGASSSLSLHNLAE